MGVLGMARGRARLGYFTRDFGVPIPVWQCENVMRVRFSRAIFLFATKSLATDIS